MSERAKERKSGRVSIMGRYLSLPVLFIWILTGCYSSPDTFGKLDVAKWRSDRGGCNGVRAGLLPVFNATRQEFKGVHVNNLGGILGRPDVNMIADRNQKYYVYFLEKGIHCDDPKQRSQARSVAFRISAIGLVTEITFQNGTP